MATDWLQGQINLLLEGAAEAIAQYDWEAVRQKAQAVLALDPENSDGNGLLAAADRAQGAAAAAPTETVSQSSGKRPTHSASPAQPTSFADGRYQVKRFLGEGGKKMVYLAHDTLLDREVAFALIKTDGLDETSRIRISREAQAMGRLDSNPNIVTVFDLGQENGQPYMVTELMGGGDVEGS